MQPLRSLFVLIVASAAVAAPSSITVRTGAAGPLVIGTRAAEFRITSAGYIQAFLVRDGKTLTLGEPAGAAFTADYVESAGKRLASFPLDLAHAAVGPVQGQIGKTGKRVEIAGKGSGEAAGLDKTLIVEVYEDFPNLLVTRTAYRNTGAAVIRLDKAVSQRHRLNASLSDPKAAPYSLWSFQGAAYDWGRDEILRIPEKFEQQNVVGGPGPKGLGGGLPVADFWTASAGLSIGLIEPLPLIASLPVKVQPDSRIEASVALAPEVTLKPGDSYSTPRTFVAVHDGDFYNALGLWARAIQNQSSWPVAKPTPQSYEANWCGWGYESDFTAAQMLGTLPKLTQLGFKWATLDLRWFDNYGDWMPRDDTFSGNTLRNLVDEFHKQGLKVQAWYQPLSAEDGVGKHSLPKPMTTSRIIQEHPDWAILDRNGRNARMVTPVSSAAALCPALPEVQQYHRRLIERFFREYDFDGLKMDSVFSVPPCYNPKHLHRSPEDSVSAMGKVFQAIFDTAREIKPESIVQICPCGAVPSLAWVFFQDQPVTADPVGSVQVRRRIKMYKALLGPRAAVYGDHVELSGMRRAPGGDWIEEGSDFASTVGTGGVPGTKFTWPGDPPRLKRGRPTIRLTPAKEPHWKKWIDLYNAKMLSRGAFRNLYVYGYDDPEGYAIEKDGRMYYAFYASGRQWKGDLELRGLGTGRYRVLDYPNSRDLGTVDGRKPTLSVEFKDNLLLEVKKM